MIAKQVAWKQIWNLYVYIYEISGHQYFHPWSNQLSQRPEQSQAIIFIPLYWKVSGWFFKYFVVKTDIKLLYIT